MTEPRRGNPTVTVSAVTATQVVRIRATLGRGQPGVTLTGVPADTAASTRDRLYAALTNSGFTWPGGTVQLDVSSADGALSDSALDAALAVALLAASGHLSHRQAAGAVCIGELGLDGSLRPVHEMRARLTTVAGAGFTHVLVPVGNLVDVAGNPGLVVRSARTLTALLDRLREQAPPHTVAGDAVSDRVEEARIARASLAFLFEPGSRHLRDLVVADGPVAAYRQLRDGGGLPVVALRREIRQRRPAELWDAAARTVADAHLHGGRIVIPEDPDWPPRLTDLATVPPDTDTELAVLCLWARGEPPVAATLNRSIAISGARAATNYGTHVAGELGFDCAERGWTVVAGGAFGIDSAAHRGALIGGGVTVAVLPCGVDRPHPAGNRDVFAGIVERGLLVSVWPEGTLPTRARFVIRQRLLAAISAGTVLVEATCRSSCLQTLAQAITLGRPAMVVPGPVTSALGRLSPRAAPAPPGPAGHRHRRRHGGGRPAGRHHGAGTTPGRPVAATCRQHAKATRQLTHRTPNAVRILERRAPRRQHHGFATAPAATAPAGGSRQLAAAAPPTLPAAAKTSARRAGPP